MQDQLCYNSQITKDTFDFAWKRSVLLFLNMSAKHFEQMWLIHP